ncbi:MAG: hypothetical protein ACREIC_17925, partial [Limisphaerales bacterium]
MADIKFACPHCQQHITCDALWGGHQLQCPSCQKELTVPAAPAAPAPAPASLVPPPPRAAAPRVSLSQVGGQSVAQKPAVPQRAIPIRNLAAPAPKRANPIVKFATTGAVVVALGAGCYFGWIWLRDRQEKANAQAKAEEARNSGESQVGHIANLNAVLDTTEPGHFPGQSSGRASGPRSRPSGVGQEIPISPGSAQPAAANAAQLPIVPPTWTLDLMGAKIPESRVNGSISGTNFVADTVVVAPMQTAEVLRFSQGQAPAPDRELLVYLHLRPGEKLGGQSFTISSEMRGAGVPSIAKLWKTNPRYAPTTKFFSSGYMMKLELGEATNGTLPGKIFVALPDAEQTVAAGVFSATTLAPQPTAQAAPMVAPAPSAGADAYRQRYGLG